MRQERPDVQYEKIAMDWVMEYQPERDLDDGVLEKVLQAVYRFVSIED